MKYLFILFIFTGCIKENCKVIGQLRCNNNKVEICSSKKRWKLSRDCNKYKGTKCGLYESNLGSLITCVKEKK